MSDAAEKWIGRVAFALIFALMASAYMSNTLRSEDVTGVDWLLFWGLAFYLPVFPLVSCILGSGTFRASVVASINFAMTLVFSVFSWASGSLCLSWSLVLAANVVFLICALIDDKRGTSK